ncbi:MAG: carboxypeptidase-like regulatory domain-containing protein [Acidobacteriota bacterium]
MTLLTMLLTGMLAAAPQAAGGTQTEVFGAARPQAPPRDATTEKKGTGVLKGRVSTADGNKPLRRVQITVSSPDLTEPRSVSTNSQGLFEVRDLPDGRYTVSASRSGYLRVQFGQRRPGEAGRPLQLADQQTIDRVDFALPRMSVITGRVTDEIGEPLAGVTVFPMQAKYFRGRLRMVPMGGQARTDDTGEYRLIALEPGDYFVMGTTRDTWTLETDVKQRVGFGPTYFSGTLVPANAQRVKLALGQEATGLDFSMVPGRVGAISGTATSASGIPLVGESVSISQEFTGPNSSSMFGFGGGKVNADGTFVIRDVAPGDYKLAVRWPGDAERPAEAATVTVSMTGPDLEGIALVGSSGGSISGRVVTDDGSPLTLGGSTLGSGRNDVRMQVSLRAEDPDTASRRFVPDAGRVKDDGTFELTEVAGAQRLSVGPLPRGWALRSIEAGGKDYADAPIDLRNGQKLDGVTIVITNKLATVRGTLRDEAGLPAAGTVILFPADASRWSEGSRLVKTARPDPAGAFEMQLVPPGEYLAAPADYMQSGAWEDPQFLEGLRDHATSVTVGETGSTAPLALTLRKR